jgi:hypothetical protein
MGNRRLHILLSPVFLAALCLLLANDFLFKSLLHNWFTGKLSDFAGLFAFTLFWGVIFPLRRQVVFLATALGFIFWKSPHSQAIIDWCNAPRLFTVGRVVDSTDLIALAVLPLSYLYLRRRERNSEAPNHSACHLLTRRIAVCATCAAAAFAFTATSFVNDRRASIHKEYEFAYSRNELAAYLKSIGLTEVERIRLSDEQRETYILTLAAKFCDSSPTAWVTLHEQGGKTVLDLGPIRYWCGERLPQHDEELLRIFEREVIEKLRAKG